MSDILTQIVGLLTSGLQSFGQGIGSGLNTLVTSIFVDSSGTTQQLSVFGGVIVIFGAIALCIGISKWVVNMLTSWGN